MMELVSTTIESYCGKHEIWQKVETMAESDGSLEGVVTDLRYFAKSKFFRS